MRWDIPHEWDVSPYWYRCRMVNFTFQKLIVYIWYENELLSPSSDLTSTQVKSHWSGIIFFHVNSFSWSIPPMAGLLFSLASVCLYNYFVKKFNLSSEWSSADLISNSKLKLKKMKITYVLKNSLVGWLGWVSHWGRTFSHVKPTWKVSHWGETSHPT